MIPSDKSVLDIIQFSTNCKATSSDMQSSKYVQMYSNCSLVKLHTKFSRVLNSVMLALMKDKQISLIVEIIQNILLSSEYYHNLSKIIYVF